jgi:hypothetical protein
LARNGWRVSVHAGLGGFWLSDGLFPHIKINPKFSFFFSFSNKQTNERKGKKTKKEEKVGLIYKSLLIDIYI